MGGNDIRKEGGEAERMDEGREGQKKRIKEQIKEQKKEGKD